jgi:hypothetical protein
MTQKDSDSRDEATKQALIDALEKGFASGVSSRALEEIWESAKERARSSKR